MFARLRNKLRPRMGTVLLAVQLMVLLLPLAGIAGLRIYESALVRQTENALVSQAAFIGATYRYALKQQFGAASGAQTGCPPAAYSGPESNERVFQLRSPQLDLASDGILPEAPPPAVANQLPLAWAEQAAPAVQEVMANAQVVTLSAMRLTDCLGTIIASTGGDHGRSLLVRTEVQDGLRGEHRSVMRARSQKLQKSWLSISRGAKLRVTVVMPVEWQQRVVGTVLLERTPASVIDTLWGKRGELGFAIVALLLLVVLFAFITAYFISGPIRALRTQVALALAGNKGAVTPLSHSGTVEMRQLSEDVAELAQTLEERADYINRFAAQVSHEFKTPLTSVRGAVELLRDHADVMPAERRERFLNNLLADANRLELLVSRLLGLARADVLRPSGERCNWLELLNSLQGRYADKPLTLAIDWPDGVDQEALMAVDLAGSVLTNLLDNACQHGADSIVVSASESDGSLELMVADNGDGVSAANAEKIFEPFFTTARGKGGTGLGLPTIKALLEAHGGSLDLLESEPGNGAAFRLRVPFS